MAKQQIFDISSILDKSAKLAWPEGNLDQAPTFGIVWLGSLVVLVEFWETGLVFWLEGGLAFFCLPC